MKSDFDVFISYSSTDRAAANAVCAALEAEGIDCWIAPRDISAGVEYAEALIDALDHCRALVLIFSSAANQSPQVRREIERVMSRGVAIVPVRVEDIMPSGAMAFFLSSVHWLNAFESPLDNHLRQLTGILTARLKAGVSSGSREADRPASVNPLPADMPAVSSIVSPTVPAQVSAAPAATAMPVASLAPSAPSQPPFAQSAWMRELLRRLNVTRPLGGRLFTGRSLRYWASAIAVTLLSFLVTPYVEDSDGFGALRDKAYQVIAEHGARPVVPNFTRLVWVEDEDFFRGPPMGHSPISRAYLASIVTQLDRANVPVIALDFDVRLNDPEAAPTLAAIDDRAGTDALITAIVEAAKKRKVVLSRTIGYGKEGGYAVEPDIYQPYGICAELGGPYKIEKPIDPKVLRNISCGYIALPGDMKALPQRLPIGEKGQLNSFSLAVAIAGANDPERIAKLGDDTLYGTYIPVDAMKPAISAGQLLKMSSDDLQASSLARSAVIVGGHWSSRGFRRGGPVDIFATPAGDISGSMVHQNYAEAYLDGRYYRAVPAWLLNAGEWIFAIAAILIFSLYSSFLPKLALFLGLTAFMFFVQWFMLQLAGMFLDAFIPLLAVWLHSLFARVLG